MAKLTKIRLPSTAVYMNLQPESETAFVLHLKTPRMLKAEVSSHLLLMVLLQEKNFAEYSFTSYRESFIPKLSKYFSKVCWIVRRLAGHLPDFCHSNVILFVFSIKERSLTSKSLKC